MISNHIIPKKTATKIFNHKTAQYCFEAGFINRKEQEIFYSEKKGNHSFRMVLQGSGTLKNKTTNQTYNLKAGDFFQTEQNHLYSLNIDNKDKWLEFYISIPIALLKILIATNGVQKMQIVKKIPITNSLIASFINYLSLISELKTGKEHLILKEACTLIPNIYNAKKLNVNSQPLKNIKNYLFINCHKKINIEALAKKYGYNYENFRKNFKKYYHVSPYKYIKNCRMKRATKLLFNLDYSIKDVANELGYARPQEFSNHFKQHFDIPPSDFRKLNLNS